MEMLKTKNSMRVKPVLLMLLLLKIVACHSPKSIMRSRSLEVLAYEGNKNNYKEIACKNISKPLKDSILIEKKRNNLNRSRLIAFENTLTRHKYVFNYFGKDYYYIMYSCDTAWNIYRKVGSFGEVH